jgi:NitT/TauT family transport system substrate-binding protein
MKKGNITKICLLVLFIVCIGCIFCLTGCNKKSKERTVTINTRYTSLDLFTSVVIKEKKLMEKYLPEGVTVKWTSIVSGSEERDALVSGSIDIGNISVIAFATALANGMPLEYISYEGANLYQLYARDPSINSISDLKSSDKISVSSIGTGPHTSFLLAAQKDTGSVSKFANSMITMTNSDAVTALISGTSGVDAVVCTFPTIIAAWESDEVHCVRDLSEEIKEYGIGNAFLTTEKYAEENPDIIDAFIKAKDEAVDMMHNNREECISLMMSVYDNVNEEMANMMLDYYVDFVDNGEGKYDKLMNFLYENGILETEPISFDSIPKYQGNN